MSLFHKAWGHLKSAKFLFLFAKGDEDIVANAAYHLQQAVETAMKFALEIQGVNYPKTHEIETLILLGKQGGAQLYLTEYMEDHAEMFTSWESKTRYIVGFLVEAKKVERAIGETEKYLLALKEGLDRFLEDPS